MPIAKVQLEDGRVVTLEVQEGTTEQQIIDFVSANKGSFAQPQTKFDLPVSERPTGIEELGDFDLGRALSGVGERIRGGLEAAGTLVSGAVAEPVSGLAGIGRTALPGETGVGARTVEDIREALTFTPRTARGREVLQAVSGTIAPILEPLIQAGEIAGGGTLEATGSPALASGVQTLIQGAPDIIGARFGLKASGQISDMFQNTSQPSLTRAQMGFNAQDLSSARVDPSIERQITAEGLPIPFEGESALTKGQVTRNFEQLQFEKEAAKDAQQGQPLRERLSNQTETLMMNLDAIGDMAGPAQTELRDIGQSVDSALMSRQKRLKSRVDRLYSQARQAGEMEASINLGTVPGMLEDIQRFEGVAPNAGAIRKEALRLGIVDEDLNPLPVSLDNAELFRSFVNSATDITNAQQARIRRIAVSAIDDATENAGGDIFKQARRARAEMARELENVGLTKRLLSTKKGTDERAIAYEDVFKKVILDSPIEEINKLRGTLLKSGDEGKQAWTDLKAQGVEYMKNFALSPSQMDEMGVPLFSPDKFNRVVKSMDDKGKLDKIYGKKNAQAIRDLADLSKFIFTAPVGAVNHSNTAAIMGMMLETTATTALTGGIPAPAITALMGSLKLVKNKQKRNQIRESLDYLNRQ